VRLYKVEIADEAWRAIEAQVRYIAAEGQAPERAAKWADRLLAAVGMLERMPRRFVLDRDQTKILGVKVHRLVFERTYLVFYAVDDAQKRVNVLSFRHGAQERSTAP
jgi:plasmid stabilization system protein ParE